MRRDHEHFGDQELELIQVAKRLKEALAVESALEAAGEDYLVSAEKYRARLLMVMPVERVGAYFYVPIPRAEACRILLKAKGFTVIVPDPDSESSVRE